MIARVAIVAVAAPGGGGVARGGTRGGGVCVWRSDGCAGRAAHAEPAAAHRSGRHVARSGPPAGHLARVRHAVRSFFGWAKPVPIDPRWFRRPRLDWLLVALAGPGDQPRPGGRSARVALGWLAGRARARRGRHRFLSALVAQSVRHQLRAGRLQPAADAAARRRPRARGAAAAAAAARLLAQVERVGLLVVLLVVMNTGILSTLVRPVLSLLLRPGSRTGGRVGGRRSGGRQVIVSGARPTGRLHLGNWHGALKNWVRLQHEHECFFFVADWHALTTDLGGPERHRGGTDRDGARLARGRARSRALHDLPAVGGEGARRALPAARHDHAGAVARAQSRPTRSSASSSSSATSRPSASSAIRCCRRPTSSCTRRRPCRSGIDQVPHIELTREIARRFNHLPARSSRSRRRCSPRRRRSSAPTAAR